MYYTTPFWHIHTKKERQEAGTCVLYTEGYNIDNRNVSWQDTAPLRRKMMLNKSKMPTEEKILLLHFWLKKSELQWEEKGRVRLAANS